MSNFWGSLHIEKMNDGVKTVEVLKKARSSKDSKKLKHAESQTAYPQLIIKIIILHLSHTLFYPLHEMQRLEDSECFPVSDEFALQLVVQDNID